MNNIDKVFFKEGDIRILCMPNVYTVKKWLINFFISKNFKIISEKPLFVVNGDLENIKLIFISHLDTLERNEREYVSESEICCKGAILSRASLISLSYMLSLCKENCIDIKNIGLIFSEKGLYDFKDISNLPLSILPNIPYILISMPTAMQVFSISKGFMKFKIEIEGISSSSAIPWYSTNMLNVIRKIYKNIMDNWPKHDIYPTSPIIASPDILTFFLLGTRVIYLSSIKYIGYPTILSNKMILEIDVSYPPADNKTNIIHQVRDIIDKSIEKSSMKYSIDMLVDLAPHITSPSSYLISMIKESAKNILGYEPYFDWYPIPNPSSIFSSMGFRDIIIFGPGDFRLIGTGCTVRIEDITKAGEIYHDLVRRMTKI